jgi:hypothetical protein
MRRKYEQEVVVFGGVLHSLLCEFEIENRTLAAVNSWR